MALKEDIKRLEQIVGAVNEMVRQRIMQELTATPHVYVLESILQKKDAKYMRNWCQNIFRVWMMTYKPEDINSVELVVFNKESGDLICRYSENNGLKYS